MNSPRQSDRHCSLIELYSTVELDHVGRATLRPTFGLPFSDFSDRRKLEPCVMNRPTEADERDGARAGFTTQKPVDESI